MLPTLQPRQLPFWGALDSLSGGPQVPKGKATLREEDWRMGRTATMTVRVEWGDCDPAGIVYYPNFFHWCDVAMWNLFAECGLPMEALQKHYGAIGLPLLEASAAFRVASRPRDLLTIRTSVELPRRKLVELRHAFSRDGVELLEARELRIWTLVDATRSNGMRAAEIPREVVARLTAPGEPGVRG
jgi:4-hydroxybenzoyl-CoA thioesterase